MDLPFLLTVNGEVLILLIVLAAIGLLFFRKDPAQSVVERESKRTEQHLLQLSGQKSFVEKLINGEHTASNAKYISFTTIIEQSVQLNAEGLRHKKFYSSQFFAWEDIQGFIVSKQVDHHYGNGYLMNSEFKYLIKVICPQAKAGFTELAFETREGESLIRELIFVAKRFHIPLLEL